MTSPPELNDDFYDMLSALQAAGAQFVVVGAYALAIHGVPRATGDIDIFISPTRDNASRVVDALRRFGAPLEAHSITESDFTVPGTVYQIGTPPRRIDLLTAISGLTFDDAMATSVEVEIAGLSVRFLGLNALIRNKRAAGRDKDLVDVRILEER